jgi:hypothetical protein
MPLGLPFPVDAQGIRANLWYSHCSSKRGQPVGGRNQPKFVNENAGVSLKEKRGRIAAFNADKSSASTSQSDSRGLVGTEENNRFGEREGGGAERGEGNSRSWRDRSAAAASVWFTADRDRARRRPPTGHFRSKLRVAGLCTLAITGPI